MAVDFRETMRSLPPYARSRLPWKSMSIGQILKSDDVTETLSTKRIEGHLKRMNAIFNDLAERRLVTFNIFKDVQIKTTSPRKYQPFQIDELEAIFAFENVQRSTLKLGQIYMLINKPNPRFPMSRIWYLCADESKERCRRYSS